MSDKDEALRLADALTECHHIGVGGPDLQAATLLRRQHAEIESLKAEHEEDQGVIRVWRRRTEQAEAERDALRAALEKIARVNAMDYEYQAWAQAAIDAAREAGK